MDRRDFIKKISGVAIGGALCLHLSDRAQAAELPWEKRDDSILIGEEGSLNLSPMQIISPGIKNEQPALSISEEGRIHVVYVSEKNEGEGIYLREFANGKFSEPLKIGTCLGFESRPQIAAHGKTIHIVWAALRNGQSHIIYRTVDDGNLGDEIVLSGNALSNRKPCIALDLKGVPFIAWECKENDHYRIKLRRPDSAEILEAGKEGKDNFRPALCAAPDGAIWLAWDIYEGNGNYDIYLKNLSDSNGKEFQITNHPATDIAPAIAADKEGYIWVAWQTNRRDNNSWDIPRWFELRAFKDGNLYETISLPPDKDLEKEGENQSFEFMQILCAPDGRIILSGRPSHNFSMQWYKGDKWSRMHRLPKDGWGGRGQYLKMAFDNTGALWMARRDLDQCVLQSLEGLNGDYIKPVLKPFALPSIAPALVGFEKKYSFPEWNDYKYFFGDIHAQTWMSDGVGDLDEFYIQHRDLLQDDFACITDHDTFVGNGIMPSEWQEQKEMATHYHQEGRFVTFYGQEWTTARWPKGFGHKNIYHIDPTMPLLDHTDEETNNTAKLFEKAKKLGAICIPHHIGWTGVDWENHDPEAQPLVEIVSLHGAYEFMQNKPIYHRGGVKGCFVQDGLARGLMFGIVGGTDTHGLIWHHHVGWKRDCLRSGLTCLLAKELTREALFDAMKNRRCYGTSGVKMRILFEVEDAMMGQVIKLDKPPRIRVEVMSPTDVQWLQIVRNNDTINTYGGEGYQTKYSYLDEGIKEGRSWYYLRVITEDGNMGWSSPIWVDYKS